MHIEYKFIAFAENKSKIYYPQPDHRTDLYSLGVTFYHCLTGVQPFAVKNNAGKLDIMATLKRQNLPLTPYASSSLGDGDPMAEKSSRHLGCSESFFDTSSREMYRVSTSGMTWHVLPKPTGSV